MRISLLLQREPFGPIVEKTLSRFWQTRYGQPYEVKWRPGRPGFRDVNQAREQLWLCNIYLNVIFTSQTRPAAFDPIRREFARSLVAWRRPLQKMYVALAISRTGAPWLAQASLKVTPEAPGAGHSLIVAGNHKLRLLDHSTGQTYGILKDGFQPQFISRELAARQMAARLGLPVPELQTIAPDGSWYSEQYLSGTPLNRLDSPEAARRVESEAAKALSGLLANTAREEDLEDYAAGLQQQVQALTDSNHLLSVSQKQQLHCHAAALARQVLLLKGPAGNCLLTAQTHGDFQPGNILANQDGVWLIDWEYSARRQAGYDALVFTLRSRFPKNLAARVKRFTADGLEAGTWLGSNGRNWIGLDARTAASRQLQTSLFLLEELKLYLEENSNPLFSRLGSGLLTLIDELAQTK